MLLNIQIIKQQLSVDVRLYASDFDDRNMTWKTLVLEGINGQNRSKYIRNLCVKLVSVSIVSITIVYDYDIHASTKDTNAFKTRAPREVCTLSDKLDARCMTDTHYCSIK